MYDLFYNLFTSSDMLGGAMQYESTAIICRYMSIGCTIALFIGLMATIVIFFKLIKNWLF